MTQDSRREDGGEVEFAVAGWTEFQVDSQGGRTPKGLKGRRTGDAVVAGGRTLKHKYFRL
uniref:HDC19995 n=1 Tax=Drosophila melanogaster TaxID=7227 RepID=Q6II20_DROME|nr:TPA_inf: HDC19995 [Drosophila melanogaster]